MVGKYPTIQEALDIAKTAQDTALAKGEYRAFFERNKEGIQYVDVSTRTYYVSRSHSLRGPIPVGVRIEHTGLPAATKREHKRFKRSKKH